MTPSVIVASEQFRTASHPAVQTDRSAKDQPTDKEPAKNPTEYRFVFIGNSHSIVGKPFDHLQKMIKARDDKPTVSGQTVAVDFLDALDAHKATWEKPDFAAPGILVLQGQKISMSGRYSYSTQTATDIARIFSEKGTRVLLFAEWGQAGVAGDGVRIQGIYEQIATAANADRKTNTPVEVAPIGLVWDAVLKKFPDQKLHDADGNHSNELGGFVTAIAFYCWLFDELPPEKSLPRKNHKYLKEVSQIAIEICRRQKSRNTEAAESVDRRPADEAGNSPKD
ncbi:MAG: hypothetical protein U0996_10305 [Planctomycetaceae bacterium]